jgi:DNA-binding FadR family transcriptional regulator
MTEPLPPRARDGKLAEQISRTLEDRILTGNWPVGYALGTEAELAASAGVSRWTMREAISLLERSGLLESRRGINGGLFVAAPASVVIRNRLANYLEFIRPSPQDLSAVQRALSFLGLELAGRNRDRKQLGVLRALLQQMDTETVPEIFATTLAIRESVFALADAPALQLLQSVLAQARSGGYYRSSLDDAALARLNQEVVDTVRALAGALIDGDMSQALAMETRFIALNDRVYSSAQETGDAVSEHVIDRTLAYYPTQRPRKKSERVFQLIRQEIIGAGWPVGRLLGSEAELMQRYGVGRAVLREAIRSLEHLGVVAMGRGGASGLRIISPDPQLPVDAGRRYLRRIGVSAAELSRLRQALVAIPAHETAQPHSPTADFFLQILDVPIA